MGYLVTPPPPPERWPAPESETTRLGFLQGALGAMKAAQDSGMAAPKPTPTAAEVIDSLLARYGGGR